MKMLTKFTRKKISRGGKTHMEITLTPPNEPRDKRPVCLVLAIDMSQEMGEPEKRYGFTEMYTPIMSRVHSAAYSVIRELGDEDIFGCAVFNHEGFVCQELIHPVSAMVPDIKVQVSRIEPHGGRNIEEGLRQASLLITQRALAGYKCQIILVTCGKTDTILKGKESLPDICKILRERGISVSMVGCGQGYDMHSFIEMTEAGGGRAHHVQNYEHLEEIFIREIESLRKESARDIKLTIKSKPPLEIGKNLNGYPQIDKRGKSEISVGNLCEPVSLYFEIAYKGSKNENVDMEISSAFKEEYKIVTRKTEFHNIEIAKQNEEVASLPYDSKVLTSWLGAFTACTIKDGSIKCDKCKLSLIGPSLEKAKIETTNLSKIYAGAEPLLEKCCALIEKEGKIFFKNSLGIGENKAVYFELTDSLRRNSKKTIKNLYI